MCELITLVSHIRLFLCVCVCVCVCVKGEHTEPSVVLTRLLHYACWQLCLSPLKAHLVSPLYLVSLLIELFVWHFPLYWGCYNTKVSASTTCHTAATHTGPRMATTAQRSHHAAAFWRRGGTCFGGHPPLFHAAIYFLYPLCHMVHLMGIINCD